jgi:transposase
MKLPPQDYNNQPLNTGNVIAELQDLLSKKSDVIVEQQHRIKILEEYLRLANSKRFSSSSEQPVQRSGSVKRA